MNRSTISLKNPKVITLFLFTIILETIGILIVGLEFYNLLIVSLILLFGYLILIEPFFGFILLIFVSFFLEGQHIETLVLFNLYGFHWYLMDLTFFLIFISIFFRFISGQYRIQFNIITFWFIFLYFAIIISTIWGLKSGHSLQNVFYDVRSFFYYLVFIPTFFVFEDFKKIKKILVFILILATIKCTVDTFASLFFLPKGFDPNLMEYLPFARLIGYNEIVYPITLISALNYFFFSKNMQTRLLLIPAIIFSFTSLILSYTRGSWLAVILTLVLEFVFLLKTKRIKVKVAVVLVSTIIVVAIFLLLSVINVLPINIIYERATSLTLHKVDISNFGRIIEYATAFAAFLRNPLFGAGLGYKYVYYTPGIGERDTIYCHNSYLYILSKTGLIGFIPFIILIILFIKIGYDILKSQLDIEEINIGFIFVMIFATIAFKSLTTWHMNTVTFSLFVGFLFGIMLVYKNKLRANC